MFDRYTNGAGRWQSGLCYRYLHRLANAIPSLWSAVDIEIGIRVAVIPYSGGAIIKEPNRKCAEELEIGGLLVTRLIDLPAGSTFSYAIIIFSNVAQGSVLDSLDGIRCLLRSSAIQLCKSAKNSSHTDDCAAGKGTSDRSASDRNTSDHSSSNRGSQTSGHGEARASGDETSPRKPNDQPPPADADRTRLLDPVRKLFAMARQTDASPQEAEIALRRCHSLREKYGITKTDLTTSAFGNAEFTNGRTLPMYVRCIASAVSKLHDVLCVTGYGGFAESRGFEVARVTLDYLLDAVNRSPNVRKCAGDFPPGRSAAFDYRIGYAMEVCRRVKEKITERKRAQEQEYRTGTSFAVGKREIVERECGQNLSSSTFCGRGARDAAARAAGTNDGARVSLDQLVEGTHFRALPGR